MIYLDQVLNLVQVEVLTAVEDELFEPIILSNLLNIKLIRLDHEAYLLQMLLLCAIFVHVGAEIVDDVQLQFALFNLKLQGRRRIVLVELLEEGAGFARQLQILLIKYLLQLRLTRRRNGLHQIDLLELRLVQLIGLTFDY